nr:unnamed protein product [Callosobruchus chinensis]
MHMDEVKVNDKCHVDAKQKNPQTETTQKELDLPAETLDNWIQQLQQQVVQNEEAATSDAAPGNQEEIRSLEGETNERVATIVNRSQLELVVDEEKLETLLALKRAAESDMDDPLQLVQGPSTSLELMTVSKTAEVAVPLLGDVFCCESCVFMSNSEPVTEQHVRDVHFSHGKYKVLNTLQCEENSDEYVACQWCDEAGDEIRIRKHFMQSHPANKFNIYRFSCAYCNRKFLQLAGLRMHNQRMHPQYPIRFESVKEKLVGRDVNPVSATATKRQRYYPKQTKRYQCPMCSYCRVCGPEFMSNVRSHLRTHFKIFNFPRRAEASDHQRRIHPRIPGCIKTEISESMLEVWQSLLDSAEVVEVPTATTSATAATTSSLTPSDEDSSSTSSCTFTNATSSRNIAKKSTSASHQPLAIGVPPPAAEMEPFSYYGTEEEPLFLQDIMTKMLDFDLDELSAEGFDLEKIIPSMDDLFSDDDVTGSGYLE